MIKFIDLFAGVGGFLTWYDTPIWLTNTPLTPFLINQSLLRNTALDSPKSNLERSMEFLKRSYIVGLRSWQLRVEFPETQTKKAATMPLGKAMKQGMQPSMSGSEKRGARQVSVMSAKQGNTSSGQISQAISKTSGTTSKCANLVTQNTTENIKTLRYIDLFAGVGGFRLGIENVNKYGIKRVYKSKNDELQTTDDKHLLDSNNPQRTTFTCVYSNEWDKYANSVYRRHYGQCDNRDIRTVTAKEIPDHDLLVGGFPCQAFSIAGKRGGFDDTRGTLFFEIARILADKRPRYFLLENVKGLLSHDSGKTFSTILRVLADLGYDYQWQVLNSKDFGVPQNRERVFIVGHLRGTCRPEVFPITRQSNQNTTVSKSTKTAVARTLTAGGHSGGNHSGMTILQLVGGSQGNRVYDPSGVSTTLASQAGGMGAKTGLYAVLTPDRLEKRQNGRRFKEDGEPAFTLTAQDRHGVFDGVAIRRLTPIECERLQGFPDNWTQYGADAETISDTQRYKMMGNAVTTNVVSAVVSRMFPKEGVLI